MGSPNVKMMLN